MRKYLSFLLTMALLAGILVTGASANFSKDPGVYTAFDGTAPSDHVAITLEYDGDRFLGAYYAVSYTSMQACTVYYYHPELTNPILEDAPAGTTITPVQNFPHLFAVTLPAGQRGTIYVSFRTDWGSGEIIRFSDGTEVPTFPQVFIDYNNGDLKNGIEVTEEFEGDKFIRAYFAVPFTSLQETTVYFFHPRATGMTIGKAPEGTTLTPVVDYPHLFKVTLPANQHGTVDVGVTLDSGGGELIRFSDGTPGHVPTELPAVAPTCTETGLTAGSTCSICGKVFTKQEVVPALGHKEAALPAIEATCTAEGKTAGIKCELCGKVLKAQETIPAKDHTEVTDAAKAATCTEVGLTEGTHCSVCNEVLKAQEIIPAKDHSFAEGKCTVCGAADPNYEPPKPVENPFTDVNESDWYAAPVLWAKESGVTGGKTETTFAPSEDCTRAQVVTFLWAANGKPEPKSMDNPFIDVPDSAWYLKPVLWAVENGITGGISATEFGPDRTCTRAQIVTFLYAAAKKPDISGSSPFTDVDNAAWYVKPVLWAAQNEVTGGIGNNCFGPEQTCTRAQVVTFLYKVYGTK